MASSDSTDMQEATNATVRRALAANGWRTDAFRVITDRRDRVTDIHCSASANSDVWELMREWFPHANSVVSRSGRVHIIW